MCKYTKIAIAASVVLLLALVICTPVLAEEASDDGAEAWRAVDEELRQAMVEEISARRGLDARDQNPDWLIQSAEDIEEALRVSCEISSDACSDLVADGAQLEPPPGYTVEQGIANARAIQLAKSGWQSNEN